MVLGLLGIFVGVIGSGISFVLISKMQQRDKVNKELVNLIRNAGKELGTKGDESTHLAITSGSKESKIEKTRQEYLSEIEKLREDSKAQIRSMIQEIEEIREASAILAKHQDVSSLCEDDIWKIYRKCNNAKDDVVSYFEKFEKKRGKQREISSLSDIYDISGILGFIEYQSSTRKWLKRYKSQQISTSKLQSLIEEAELLYRELTETYDKGYLVDVVTRMKSVDKIKTKLLNGAEIKSDSITFLENAIKKLEQTKDIPALVSKEMKKEVSTLKRISKVYMPTDAKSRADYEFLASRLSEILATEDWGTNPRMAIHEQRGIWIAEADKRFQM